MKKDIHRVSFRYDHTKYANAKVFEQILDNNVGLNNINILEYIISREVSKEAKKTHYHGQINVKSYLEGKSVKHKIREAIKSMGLEKHQVYVSSVRDELKHLAYITKELDIVVNKWQNSKLLKKAVKETKRINFERKSSMKKQLLEHISNTKPPGEESSIWGVTQVAVEVVKYHVERDYLPPTKSLLTIYIGYILTKLYSKNKGYCLMIEELYNL